MDRSRMYLLVFGGLVFLLAAQHLVGHLTRASDIWWTSRGLSPALTDVADRVEVYVRDVPLQEHVRSGRIQVVSASGATAVTVSDIRFRFNNWDRVRAQEIPGLLVAAACLGASGVCLFLGIVGWMPARKPPPTA